MPGWSPAPTWGPSSSKLLFREKVTKGSGGDRIQWMKQGAAAGAALRFLQAPAVARRKNRLSARGFTWYHGRPGPIQALPAAKSYALRKAPGLRPCASKSTFYPCSWLQERGFFGLQDCYKFRAPRGRRRSRGGSSAGGGRDSMKDKQQSAQTCAVTRQRTAGAFLQPEQRFKGRQEKMPPPS